MSASSASWILYDKHKTGSMNQCKGLARALGLDPRLVPVSLPLMAGWGPLVWLERWTGFSMLPKPFRPAPSWPRLVIASGRQAVALAARIRRLSQGQTRAIILQKPSRSMNDFDHIICPRHDCAAPHPRMLETLGSLHHLTTATLKVAGEGFCGPRPLAGIVLVGHVPADLACTLATCIAGWAQQTDGHWQIIASRRTRPPTLQALRASLPAGPGTVTLWDPSQGTPNPYTGALACAERIVVTGDSVNMLTESCLTGRPVYIWQGARLRPKFRRFHESLVAAGHARMASHDLPAFTPLPLDETTRIARLLHPLLRGVELPG